MREQQARKRDPERRGRILAAAAELISASGYHAVGMADIGREAGIVGSGIYRHFPSKAAILSELLAQAMDTFEAGAAGIATAFADDRDALTALVGHHVRVAVVHRQILQVYHGELHSLVEEDRRKLRRAQRHYVEEWVSVVGPLRRDLSDPEVRLTVHASIGAIQSILFHKPGVQDQRLVELLVAMAHQCLAIPPSPDVAPWPVSLPGSELAPEPVPSESAIS